METLVDLLRTSTQQSRDRPALIVPHGEGHRTITYAGLLQESLSAARGLRRLGLRRGDAIALWLPNIPEWLTLEFGATAIGLLVIGLNTRYRTEEVVGILTAAQVRCLVIHPGFLGIDFSSMAARVRERVPSLEYLLEIPTGYSRLLSQEPATALPDHHPEDPGNVFTTSGTTASPKLAVHDQGSIVKHAYADARSFEIGGDDVMLCVLPLCGVFGFSSVMAALAAGATCVFQTRFDARHSAEIMARYGVTHLNGTDGMLNDILSVQDFAFERLRRLRVGGFADFSGRLQHALRAFEERVGTDFGGLGGTYGSSELFALLSRWPASCPLEERAHGGGRLVSREFEVRSVDPESGRTMRHREPGELQFRGYPLMARYLNNPVATAEALTADGWFRTGDLGYTMDDASFVYLARARDSLRLSGFLVDPREIEEFLERHDGVEMAQVVGISLQGGNETPVAFVKRRPGASCTSEELGEYCRRSIAEYKVPQHVFFVETFPTTPSANGDKIQRAELRRMAEESLGGIRKGRPARAETQQ